MNTLEIIFLGTGAGVPAKERNVTCIALQLLEERGSTWLFDCGEATQHQILHTSIRPRRIEKIFITHLHGDHIFGLPGLLSSRSFQGGDTPLTIYGPQGIKDYVEVSLRVSRTHLRYDLKIVEIDEGIIFEDTKFIVEARLLQHGIPSYGFRIIEKNLPGALLVEELKRAGIEPGPLYKKVKQGELITLEDGSTIEGSQYIGPPTQGRIVTILGDTRFTEANILLAKNADLLIHEATFSGQDEELAHEYFHSTTVQAAKVAKEADVKQLILTHISSRYQKGDSVKLCEEAKRIFSNVEVAHDLYLYKIARRGAKRVE